MGCILVSSLAYFGHESQWEQIGRTLQGLSLRCRELGAEPDAEWAKLPVRELATTLRAAEALNRLPCDALVRALLGGAESGNLLPGNPTFVPCAAVRTGHAWDHPRRAERPPSLSSATSGWSDEQLLDGS